MTNQLESGRPGHRTLFIHLAQTHCTKVLREALRQHEPSRRSEATARRLAGSPNNAETLRELAMFATNPHTTVEEKIRIIRPGLQCALSELLRTAAPKHTAFAGRDDQFIADFTEMLKQPDEDVVFDEIRMKIEALVTGHLGLELEGLAPGKSSTEIIGDIMVDIRMPIIKVRHREYTLTHAIDVIGVYIGWYLGNNSASRLLIPTLRPLMDEIDNALQPYAEE